MAYRFERDESLGTGVRRVVHEQVDDALASLGQVAESGDPEGVHDVRKRCKKLRAVARLVRGAVGDDEYRAVNGLARDAARRLSGTRDAQVLAENLDAVLAWSHEHHDADRRHYQSARTEAQRRAAGGSAALEEARHAAPLAAHELDDLRARVDAWELPDEFGSFVGGLERIYRRGRKEHGRVVDEPTDEGLHEWRKRVKDLWYFTRLLYDSAPAVVGPMEASFHELSDLLGDDHDLAVLSTTLVTEHTEFGGEQRAKELAWLAGQRRDELQEQARELGRQLHAEKPKAFVARLGRYWDTWRSP